jgi:type II secretory pathway component PulF
MGAMMGLVLLYALGWTLLTVMPAAVVVWVLYYLMSLPLRRQERARLFVDLLETSAQAGHSPEAALVALSRTRDVTLGARFHWLAALVESGERLGAALARVPGYLPPRVRALVQVGCSLGDVSGVLPACRHQLRDGLNQAQGALHYLVLLVLGVTPAVPAVFLTMAVFVFPKLRAILEEMEVPFPPLLQSLLNSLQWVTVVLVCLLGVMWGTALVYLGGPRLARWLQFGRWRLADGVAWMLPWKRARLRRDFVSVLALLLDGGVPEGTAVRLAAESTDNARVQERAQQMQRDLESGRGLPAALRHLDDSRELSWRLGNTVAGGQVFSRALAGWLESLDARAFRQEQVSAQLFTTSILLVNGVLVGLVVVATFQVLLQIVNEGVLW